MKTEILKMLKETPDFLSGQQLCEGLGVSRNSCMESDTPAGGGGLCH